MIRKIMREHPFLSYYLIAVAFPSLLFTYPTADRVLPLGNARRSRTHPG